jgi:cysteine desulfurase
MAAYLDYNASAPVRKAAVEAMIPHLRQQHGNPSSAHSFGRRATEAISLARQQVADLINARAEEIAFVSGGTEANVMVLSDVLQKRPGALVIAEFEHPSIYNSAARLEKEGIKVIRLPILPSGVVDVSYLAKTIAAKEISLVSVMAANNETGVLQPVAEIANICRDSKIPFHTDAAQAVGKSPFNVAEINPDFATIAAHKMGGPIGIGALYIKSGYQMGPIFEGGDQENGLRPGTEFVPAIVGFGAACEIAAKQMPAELKSISALRNTLEENLLKAIPGSAINGGQEERLSNTCNIALPGCLANSLVAKLDQAGFAVSSGSACHSGAPMPSRTLAAMGLTDLATSSLRISLGAETISKELDAFVEALSQIVAEERSI